MLTRAEALLTDPADSEELRDKVVGPVAGIDAARRLDLTPLFGVHDDA